MTDKEKEVISLINKEEIVSLMQAMIRARSDYPYGDTRKIARVCMEKFAEYGIPSQIYIAPESVGSLRNDGVDTRTMPNVIAEIKGIVEGPLIVMNAHMDTVSAGDLTRWKYDPYAAEIDNGEIFGRGAGDDKGALLAQVMAACIIKKAGVHLKGTLQINPCADEEASSFRGTKWLRDAGILKPDILIIGEQTNNMIACAERAHSFMKVSIKGRAVHGAMPWKGINATVYMAEFIHAVNTELKEEVEKVRHPYLPFTTISTTRILGGIQVNIIPEDCELDIDCRLAPGITVEYVMCRFHEILQRISDAANEPFEWKVEKLDSEGSIPTDTSPESPLIKTMLSAYTDVYGKPSEPTGYCQASDGRLFAGWGIPIAIFGPTDPALGHSVNERVSIDQLIKAVKILILTIMRLMGNECQK